MTSLSPIYDIKDTALITLDIAAENSSELLKNRLVCKTWKQYTDELIRELWRFLKQSDPKGVVKVCYAMDAIDKTPEANSFPLFKFVELMRVFKEDWNPTDIHFPVSIRVGDIRQLQEERLQREHDKALQKIWASGLCDMFNFEDAPASKASAIDIRTFLNNHKDTLASFRELKLSGLSLTVLPPEIKLFTGLGITQK